MKEGTYSTHLLINYWITIEKKIICKKTLNASYEVAQEWYPLKLILVSRLHIDAYFLAKVCCKAPITLFFYVDKVKIYND